MERGRKRQIRSDRRIVVEELGHFSGGGDEVILYIKTTTNVNMTVTILN